MKVLGLSLAVFAVALFASTAEATQCCRTRTVVRNHGCCCVKVVKVKCRCKRVCCCQAACGCGCQAACQSSCGQAAVLGQAAPCPAPGSVQTTPTPEAAPAK